MPEFTETQAQAEINEFKNWLFVKVVLTIFMVVSPNDNRQQENIKSQRFFFLGCPINQCQGNSGLESIYVIFSGMGWKDKERKD